MSQMYTMVRKELLPHMHYIRDCTAYQVHNGVNFFPASPTMCYQKPQEQTGECCIPTPLWFHRGVTTSLKMQGSRLLRHESNCMIPQSSVSVRWQQLPCSVSCLMQFQELSATAQWNWLYISGQQHLCQTKGISLTLPLNAFPGVKLPNGEREREEPFLQEVS